MARRGWRLHPCAVRGKRPLINRWPVMASSDLATIQGWAEQFPNCNWGTATGPGSNVFVLDIDGEEGRASLAALEAQNGPMPVTLTSITGRADGGEHRWFNYPPDCIVRSSTGTVGAGLDVQSDGKQVLVPPSIHPTGQRYEWVAPGQAIADGPGWFLSLVNRNNRANNTTESAHFRPLVAGERNDTLFRLGCAMRRRGASREEIEHRLLRKNHRDCIPLLGADEIHGIAVSASRYPVGGPDPLETAWWAVENESHSRGFGQFLALARHLQIARPGLPIALPLQRIGGLMKCDWTQVRRWRRYAVRDGWLCLKENYIRNLRAAQYIFHEISTVPIKPTVPLNEAVPLEPTTGIAGQAGCA